MNRLRSASERFLNNLKRPGIRPPGEVYYSFILCALIGLWLADLSILSVRDWMLPTKAPPARPERSDMTMPISRSEYDSVITRNIFNSDGVVPEAEGAGHGRGQPENEPVPSSLPIQLIGTLVHVNPRKSVATVNLSSAGKVMSYKVDEDIEGLALVAKIERQKVIIRNSNNNRLEYIEIKRDLAFTLGVTKPQAPTPGTEIQVEGNNVTVKRSEVLKQTANLSDVLNQASAVPNFVPGSGGRINGYRLVNISPGSVFEKLGLRRFDVIKGVDGQPVDSPAKAMELYNQLKSSSNIRLNIERNGAEETLNFSIVE